MGVVKRGVPAVQQQPYYSGVDSMLESRQGVRVNGPDAAPVYKFLKAHKSGFLGSRIKWNFTKFLVDKEGTVLARYGPTTAPLTIEADIQKALGDK
ncbi:putative glutathione peroxidase 5 [Vitis vinifera]|uniref:Putative glutathione peroxidase 5 n=1 Tax=Vitis vinifera TaxID=29760 RepID=A0A438F4F0_VITVI|nr:putative glutathione peroxidase 5 [Vitis vinifera]